MTCHQRMAASQPHPEDGQQAELGSRHEVYVAIGVCDKPPSMCMSSRRI